MDNRKILLGKRIKELRMSRKFTQEKLSELIDVDPKYISLLETGNRTPSIDTLQQIADAIGVNMVDFFEFSHYKENDKLIEEIVTKLQHTSNKNVKLFYDIMNSIMNIK